MQAITVGLLWPLGLYLGSFVSPVVTQVVFGAGVVSWIVLLFGTAAGRDPRIPMIGGWLWRLASEGSSEG